MMKFIIISGPKNQILAILNMVLFFLDLCLISPLLGESSLAIRFLPNRYAVRFGCSLFIHENRFGIRTAWTAFNLSDITCDFHDVGCFND